VFTDLEWHISTLSTLIVASIACFTSLVVLVGFLIYNSKRKLIILFTAGCLLTSLGSLLISIAGGSEVLCTSSVAFNVKGQICVIGAALTFTGYITVVCFVWCQGLVLWASIVMRMKKNQIRQLRRALTWVIVVHAHLLAL
jgi:hypothetical protein